MNEPTKDLNAIEILLVEDNPNDAELALRALRKHNLANNVVHVADGAAALDYIFGKNGNARSVINHTPRLILLDLKLPKVDGLEVLRAVKGDPRTRAIPVVVLTSSKAESDIVESYSLGANSYIVKPVEFEKFVETVKHLGLYWLLINQPPVLPTPQPKG